MKKATKTSAIKGPNAIFNKYIYIYLTYGELIYTKLFFTKYCYRVIVVVVVVVVIHIYLF